MSDEQALVTIERKDAYTIFTTENGVAPIIEKLREHAANAPSNVVTLKGRKEIAAYAYMFATSKSLLESVGKELADEQKAIPKKIDAARKLLKDTCDELRDFVRKPLDDWEEAESARVEKHKAEIQRITFLSIGGLNSAEQMRKSMVMIEAIPVGPECEEFEADYARAKDDAVKSLSDQIAAREKFEADQAELEELRRMKAERDAAEAKAAAEKAEAERQAQIERDAAERARKAAEDAVKAEQERAAAAAKAAQEAAERRERELQAQAAEAERKAAQAQREAEETAARIEREAQAAKAREVAEQKAREENREHRAKINREVLADIVATGASEEIARAIITAIAKREVRHVSLNY